MAFDVSADAYARFMGRYSEPLATSFIDFVGIRRGQRALDVGCGTGIVTSELVERVGAESVTAIDPSAQFLTATRERFPSVDVREGNAEELPFDDDAFDVVVAQLVVHFMADPVRGVREMARVARPGGVVAGAGGTVRRRQPAPPSSGAAATALDPRAVGDESGLPGTREGDLNRIFKQAGLRRLEPSALTVRLTFSSFEEWWDPYLLGVGPVGDHVAGLDAQQRAALEAGCRELMARAPFEVPGKAWCVRAII